MRNLLAQKVKEKALLDKVESKANLSSDALATFLSKMKEKRGKSVTRREDE